MILVFFLKQEIRTDEVHVTLSTPLTVTPGAAGSGYTPLLTLAAQNHLPIGIVQRSGLDPICKRTVAFDHEAISLGELVLLLRKRWPESEIDVKNGVLTIKPKGIVSTETERFLGLKLPSFDSVTSTHNELGIALWMHIRSVVRPGEGTMFAGSTPMNSEKLDGMHIRNETVEEILDEIVKKGTGGVWIFKSSEIVQMSKLNKLPYYVYGLSDNPKYLATSLSCGK